MIVTAGMARNMIIFSSSGSGSHVDDVHVHVPLCTMDAVFVHVSVLLATSVIILDVLIAVMTGTVIFVTISVAVTIMNFVVLVMNTVTSAAGPGVVMDDIGQRDSHWRPCWCTWLSTKPCCQCWC